MIIEHAKNEPFELCIPMVDSTTPANFKSGISPADDAYYKDGAGAWTALAITDTFAEIDSTGLYEISLTASELNHDWVVIKVTGAGAANTFVTFRLLPKAVTIWHVAKTGSDSNAGHSFEKAKLTIGATVTAAAAGDTIIIWPGTYAENVDASSKSLTFKGIDRNSSKIVPATGTALKLNSNSVANGLNLEALEISALAIALDIYGKSNINIENCIVYGAFDGVHCGGTSNISIKNSSIKGKYDGININNAVNIIAVNSIFETDGTYGTTNPCRSIYGNGIMTMDSCLVRAVRSDITTGQELGGIYLAGGAGQICISNSIVNVNGSNMGGSSKAFGIRTNNASAIIKIMNCNIKAVADAQTVYDLENTAGEIVIGSSRYSTSSGTITRDIVDSVTGAVGSVTGNVGGNLSGSIGSLAVQAKADVQLECEEAIAAQAVAVETSAYAIQNKTDLLSATGGNINAQVNAHSTAAKAEIQTECEDAIIAKHLDHLITRANTAQGGGANTITLDVNASATNNLYNGQAILLVNGTGAGQARKIDSYNGTTKVATVDSNWVTQPVSGTEFVILDIYILTGTGATAQQVWEYATRALTDKIGFKLASDGLDSISTAEPTAKASTFREVIMQTWRRIVGKITFNKNTGIMTHYKSDGSTPVMTQTNTDDGTTQTQGEAS